MTAVTEKRCCLAPLRTRGDKGKGPWGWLRHRRNSTHRQKAGNPRLLALVRWPGEELSGRHATRHPRAAPLLAVSRTRGSKHRHVIRARLPCLSPPISPDRWTCSPPLRAKSMSRFPAVAGRAPRRQEEGERPREPQEERPSAVSIADRGTVRGMPWRLARVPAGVCVGAIKVSLGQAEQSGKEAQRSPCPPSQRRTLRPMSTLVWRGAVPDPS